MYLTRIDLSRVDRNTWFALSDCQRLHQLVMSLFNTDRLSEHVLYRIRENREQISLYLYSDHPILRNRLTDFMTLRGERDITQWVEGMKAEQHWRFDLLTSPSKKTTLPHVSGDEPQWNAKNNRRRVLRSPEERTAWLTRKGEQNGFRILSCEELEQSSRLGRHNSERGGAMGIVSYHYQGTLQITDTAKFKNAIIHGIGAGKAYGLGMLLLS